MNLASTEVSALSLKNVARVIIDMHIFQYSSNKGFAEDLTEGKFSFPVVHGIRSDPSNRQILSA